LARLAWLADEEPDVFSKARHGPRAEGLPQFSPYGEAVDRSGFVGSFTGLSQTDRLWLIESTGGDRSPGCSPCSGMRALGGHGPAVREPALAPRRSRRHSPSFAPPMIHGWALSGWARCVLAMPTTCRAPQKCWESSTQAPRRLKDS
jgi:hypothetical protein